MDYDHFLGRVQHLAQLPTRTAAVTATRATLETLGDRLTAEQAQHVAAQLPREIGVYLLHRPMHSQAYSLRRFLDYIALRSGHDPARTLVHAGAVVCVLREAVDAGNLRHMLASLPLEYRALFGPLPSVDAGGNAIDAEVDAEGSRLGR